MTITEQMNCFQTYYGSSTMPEDFITFWRKNWFDCEPEIVSVEKMSFANPCVCYEKIVMQCAGAEYKIRYLRPADDRKHPTLLMFCDFGKCIRGWHHMTRFVALGYAVLALYHEEAVFTFEGELDVYSIKQHYMAGIATARVATMIASTDTEHIVTWGEGFGAAIAIAVAAISPEPMRCAAIFPMPCDLSEEYSYVDPANFSPYLKAPFLLGTGFLDELAPPKAQYAVYNRATCEKRHLVYPKYGHERINFFENEFLTFLNY